MTFEEKFQEYTDERAAYWVTAKERQAALDKDLSGLFKKLFPKRKFKYDLMKAHQECKDLIATHQASADIVIQQHQSYESEAESELDRLAQITEIPTSDTMNCHHMSYSSGYSSQGYGASKYAQNSAQIKADLALHQGLQAEVRPVGDAQQFNGITYQNYGIFVNTTKIGWEILTRRPGPSLKETIRLCWKRGVNPRVFNPWLPVGLEEKLGLDYFGNEKAIS